MNSGVADEDRELAELGDCRCHRLSIVVELPHVTLYDRYFAKLFLEGLQAIFRKVEGNDLCPFFNEPMHHRFADAGSRSGDQGNFVLKPSHLASSPRCGLEKNT